MTIQAGGTHPTGMHSCLEVISKTLGETTKSLIVELDMWLHLTGGRNRIGLLMWIIYFYRSDEPLLSTLRSV